MVLGHEKKPLPLVAPVLVVIVAFFNLDILCLIVQEQTLFINLMDIAYIRQDRICIRCFHSPFEGYFH